MRRGPALVVLMGVILIGCRPVPQTELPAVLTVSGHQESINVHLEPDKQHGPSRFHRRIEVESGGRICYSERMTAVWRRAVRMNLYEDLAVPGSFLIQERESEQPTVYRVNPGSCSVEWIRGGVPGSSRPRFLGAFDFDEQVHWRFISVTERPELPLPEAER